MYRRLLLIFVLITLAVSCYFILRKKPEKHVSVVPQKVCKDDSLVFKQLMKIRSYQKADSFYIADVYDSAIYYFDKTLFALPLSIDVKFKQQVLNRLGYSHFLKYDFRKARFYLQEASRHLNAKDTNLVDILTYDYLGVLYQYSNYPDSALFYFEKAYSMYFGAYSEKGILAVKIGSHLGNIYQVGFNDYYNAEKYLDKSLKILENIGTYRDYDQYINILYSLSVTNQLKKDYKKALSYGLHALHFANSVKEGKRLREYCNNLVGNLYSSMFDYNRSIEYYIKALEINKKYDIPNPYNLVAELAQLSFNYYKLNNYQQTISYCKESLKIASQNAIDETYLLVIYETLGMAYLRMGYWEESRNIFDKRLNITLKHYGANNINTANSYHLLGIYNEYKWKQRPDSALRNYQKAIVAANKHFNSYDPSKNPTFKECKDIPDFYEFLGGKVLVLMRKYRLNHQDTASLRLSFLCYKLQDSLITNSRRAMQAEDSKLLISDRNKTFYEDAIECSYQLYQLTAKEEYINQAFLYVEKNKYRLLLENLKTAEAESKLNIPDSLVETEKKLNIELKYLQNQIAEEQLKKDKNPGKIKKISDRSFALVRKLEQLHNILEQRYPRYYEMKYQEPHTLISDLKAYSVKHNTAVVQYFWGNDAMYVISAFRNKVNFSKISFDHNLPEQVNRFIHLLHETNFSLNGKSREYANKSKNLLDTLVNLPLKGLAKDQEFPENMIIIPDGLLSKISFEALVTSVPNLTRFSFPNLDYLIYHSNVEYAYSFNILANEKKGGSREVHNMLCFGYSADESQNHNPGERNIPGSFKELKSVSKHFRSTIFSGDEATRQNFIDQAIQYDMLHLALHGRADEADENGTGLIFRKENNKSGSEFLYADEIYKLNLKAKVVVLSACETGLGKNYKGEGVFSMARAFSYAGCPTVVISLWNVNDHATADIMGNFYKHLSKGEQISQALRNAKLDYFKHSDEMGFQPAFWSSFVVFGDVSPVKAVMNPMIWIVPLFFLLGIGIALLKKFRKQKKATNA
jgi:Uncharacterized protein conserved in bacteria